jgi:hypothetical protein
MGLELHSKNQGEVKIKTKKVTSENKTKSEERLGSTRIRSRIFNLYSPPPTAAVARAARGEAARGAAVQAEFESKL